MDKNKPKSRYFPSLNSSLPTHSVATLFNGIFRKLWYKKTSLICLYKLLGGSWSLQSRRWKRIHDIFGMAHYFFANKCERRHYNFLYLFISHKSIFLFEIWYFGGPLLTFRKLAERDMRVHQKLTKLCHDYVKKKCPYILLCKTYRSISVIKIQTSNVILITFNCLDTSNCEEIQY